MGSWSSKVKRSDDRKGVEDLSPNRGTKILSQHDIRSPSTNICRTPIEVLNDDSTEITNIIGLVDPRSPTNEFERTPIVVPNAVFPKLRNKHLDNARQTAMYTPTSIYKRSEATEIGSSTPPRLIASNTVTRRNTEKRRSFVGLLETNIDYTETDLDDYVKARELNKSLTINVNENEKHCDPRSPTVEFLRTPVIIVDKIEQLELNESENNEDKSGSLLKLAVEEEPQEVQEDHDDQKQEREPKMEELTIDLTADVLEFDRKLTKMIREDTEAILSTPKSGKCLSTNNRTPMKDRNGFEPRKSNLIVRDKPIKGENGISKIPVFRGKANCENTAPKKEAREKKSKSKWDSNRTMLI